MGTVRRHIFIDSPAAEVWELVGDPARLHDWFPITSCEVVGNKRWINLASGLRFEEDIITLDHDLRRFQYSIVNNLIVKSHLGTVDVIPDGPNRCMVMYGTDIDPEPMGLIIIGAAGSGLEKLQEIFAAKKNSAKNGAK
ncbi:MAG: SRPBCC family protein [Actinomycetes bacterium]